MSNSFQSTAGGILGGIQSAPVDPAYYPSSFNVPGPSWEQVFGFQRIIMDLQQEVIRLQRELDKIKNTKEWLVGPETPSVDPGK